MDNKRELVCTIINNALSTDYKELRFSNTEWECIFSELSAQSLIPLVYESLARCSNIPADLLSSCKNVALSKVITGMQLIEQQNILLNELKSNKISVVVIKGTAASQYYSNPQTRVSGDVDLLVKGDEYENAKKLLCEKGYSFVAENYYHSEYVKGGVHFEIHKTLPRIVSGKYSRKIKRYLAEGFSDIKLGKVTASRDYSFQVMPSLQNGMILLMHIQQHLPVGLGFRQILDWMMYVDKCLDDEAWKIYEKSYIECGLDTPAKIVTKMCQMYLGLRTSNISWADDADAEICNALLDYIIAKGNFGIKEAEKEKGIKALTRDKNVRVGIRRLNKHGLDNWESAKKHKCLGKIAWIYTLFSYVKYIVTRENAISELIRELAISRQRRAIFKKMNIYVK